MTSDSTRIEREHLPPRGAERAQRRELARALGDRDRERVRDHEAADEERDAAEREQERLQEADEARRVRRRPRSPARRRSAPACRAAGSPRSAAVSCSGDDAGYGLGADLVELAALVEQRCAVGRSKPASVAPPRLDAPRTSRGRRSASAAPARSPRRRSCRPTSRSFLSAVALSTTTRPPLGQSPSTSESVLNSGRAGSTLKPRCGAPPNAITLPSLTRFAMPPTPPTASLDVGELRTSGSSDSSNGGAAAGRPSDEVERGLPRDRGVGAAVDLGEDAVEGALDRVGEDVRAGDHRDAEHDRDRRQRRPQLAPEQARECDAHHERMPPLSPVTRCGSSWRGSPPARSAPSSSAIRPSARKRMRSAIAAAAASWVTITVVWPYSSVAERSSARISCPVVRVEVAGGLVGEHDRRPGDERARDRDALLLAARELGRPVAAAVGEADALDQVIEEGLVGLLARDRERQQHVLLGGEHRQQVEELEDEADVLAPQQRHLVVGERADVVAGDLDACRRSAGRARRGCA